MNRLDVVLKTIWDRWSKNPEREDAYIAFTSPIYSAIKMSGYRYIGKQYTVNPKTEKE